MTSHLVTPLEKIVQEHSHPRSILDTLIVADETTTSLDRIHEIDTESHRKQALSWYQIRVLQEVQITYERTKAMLAALPEPQVLPSLKTCSLGPFVNGFCRICGLRQRGVSRA